jgi:hypothetical protein
MLGVGSVSAGLVRTITGAWPSQYVFLLRQKRRLAIPPTYTPLTWEEFLHLPEPPKAYGSADWAMVRRYSAQAVSLEAYIAEVRRMPDGDVHVHLRPTPSPQCFPKGHRETQIVSEVTPNFQPPATGWSYAVLRELCEGQRRVRIAGWLLHDFPWTGHHQWRATSWEIHPVTRLEVRDEEDQAWHIIP